MSSLRPSDSAALLAERAERARQAREEASAALDQRLYEQLQKLQARWDGVDVKNDQRREELFELNRKRVGAWSVKRQAAKERYMKADAAWTQRTQNVYQKKEQRVEA